MNPPPPLRRLFSLYFRLLLILAIAFVTFLTLAVRYDWPLPESIPPIAREQFPHRIPAKAPDR
jgi:hypothetical protein